MKESDKDTVCVFSANVIIPVSGSPLSNASVATSNGRILTVGKRDHILTKYPNADEHRWSGVIMPGLVNAHTHLQYTGFADLGVTTHDGFEEWSVSFDHMYEARAPHEDWHSEALKGANMALCTGTTTIADICTDIPAMTVLRDAGLSGYTFLEIMGGSWDYWCEEGRERFLDQICTARLSETVSTRVGISPHAPYSLDTRVLVDLTRISKEKGLRLHTHLAESNFEDAYYRDGTGPLADFVAGIWPDFPILTEGGTGLSAVEFASSTGIFSRECYIAHGIYIDTPGRFKLRETGTSVALCPRSNITIGLNPPPIKDYLTEGNPFCIGTDSLASSPSLDILEDVKLLYDLAIEQGYLEKDLSRRLINAVTLGGAKTLGMDNNKNGMGSLEPGKRADFALFDLDTTVDSAEMQIVTRGAGQCVATVVAGDLLYDKHK